jgi:hypothetical protein
VFTHAIHEKQRLTFYRNTALLQHDYTGKLTASIILKCVGLITHIKRETVEKVIVICQHC